MPDALSTVRAPGGAGGGAGNWPGSPVGGGQSWASLGRVSVGPSTFRSSRPLDAFPVITRARTITTPTISTPAAAPPNQRSISRLRRSGSSGGSGSSGRPWEITSGGGSVSRVTAPEPYREPEPYRAYAGRAA